MFKDLFGGKPWFQSVTAWGLVIAAVGTATLTAVATSGLVAPETAETLMTAVQWIGGVVAALGIRKAATSANVS